MWIMYVCMYVWMYSFTYVSINVCMYVCTSYVCRHVIYLYKYVRGSCRHDIYIYIYPYIYIYIYLCMSYLYMYVCMLCMYHHTCEWHHMLLCCAISSLYVQACIHTCITCIHTYIHIYIHRMLLIHCIVFRFLLHYDLTPLVHHSAQTFHSPLTHGLLASNRKV